MTAASSTQVMSRNFFTFPDWASERRDCFALQQCRCEDVLRCLSALAFLPVNEVTLGFGEVVAALEGKIQDGSVDRNKVEDLRAHLQYFENTYVGRMDENDFLTDALFPVAVGMSSRLFSRKRQGPIMQWRAGIVHFIVRLKKKRNYVAVSDQECNSSSRSFARGSIGQGGNSERQIFKLVQDYSNANVLLHMQQQLDNTRNRIYIERQRNVKIFAVIQM
uniref:Uncharacterized protein n=1 Tax=Ditylenchus dipsaci TaxID=166011 RepID=A0A915DR04_9BILA